MATNPLAFGPLSPESARAATLLGGPSFSGLNLSRLTGRSFGEPQQAAQSPQEPVGLATGSAAPVEEQQPLLPQGEATGERGDITQLPGFQAAVAPGGAAELPSSAELSSGEQQTVSELRNQLQRLASEGGGSQSTIDAAKAIQGLNKGLSGGLKGLKAAQGAAGLTGSLQGIGLAPGGLLGPGTTFGPLESGFGVMNPNAFSPGTTFETLGESGAGLGAGAAGAGAGALAALAPFIAQQAGLTDPYALTALQLAAPVAAPAAAGAVGGAVAGTGAMAGASGALAASAPALIASAPMAAMIIGTSLNSMLQKQAMADNLTRRYRDLTTSIPGHVAALQKAPGLLDRLTGVTDPAVAADVYKQAEDIQQAFQNTGMEDFLQGGITSVRGPAGMGDMSQSYEPGPALFKALSPYLTALDLARIRATDIAARGGQPIPDARPAMSYGISFGGPQFNDQLRPGSGNQTGPLAQFLSVPNDQPRDWMDRQTGSNVYGGAWNDALPETSKAPPEVLRYVGLPETGDYTIGDIRNYIGPGGAGNAYMSKYQNSSLGTVDLPFYRQVAAIQPGQYESSLYNLVGSTTDNPWLAQMGFGQGGMPAGTAAAPNAAAPAPDASNTRLALQRLVAQSGGQVGSLSPNVPQEFVSALRSPAALQSLLQQPGLLARLFAPQPAGA